MKVVVDTNVVVSAVTRDRDPEAVLLYIIGTSDVEWIATAAIVEEYHQVLGRPKFALSEETLRNWERLLAAAVIVIENAPPATWANDPDDAIFVACALAADADFLVTGDRGLLMAGKLGRTLVVTVSQFKRLICDAGP